MEVPVDGPPAVIMFDYYSSLLNAGRHHPDATLFREEAERGRRYAAAMTEKRSSIG